MHMQSQRCCYLLGYIILDPTVGWYKHISSTGTVMYSNPPTVIIPYLPNYKKAFYTFTEK